MQESRPDTTPRNTHKLSTPARQILPIRLQKNQYAIDLIFIECVLPLTALQPIANSVDCLMGLIDYRGKSIPVIDLGLWLGMKPTEPYNLDTPIIVCKNGQKQTAFVVSDVLQVDMIDPNSIKTKNTFEEGNSHFEATVNLKSHKVLLFDMKHVLSVNFITDDSNIPIVTSTPLFRPSTKDGTINTTEDK